MSGLVQFPYQHPDLILAIQRLAQDEQNFISGLLGQGFRSSDLVCLQLGSSKSRIIQKNLGEIYLAKYSGIRGLFRKDVTVTLKFGRIVCDFIIHHLNNQGFFTTDELPAYGVSFRERKEFFQKLGAEDKDLVAVFAYDYPMACKTKTLLDEILFDVVQYLSLRF